MRVPLMATLLLAATIAAPAVAQQRGPSGGAPGRPMQPPTIEEMTTRLSLTPAQAKEVGALRAEYAKATAPQWKLMDQMRAARQGGASDDSMAVLRGQMQAQMPELRRHTEAYEAAVQKILTAEQQKTWQAWRDERRQQMRGGMGQNRQGAPGR